MSNPPTANPCCVPDRGPTTRAAAPWPATGCARAPLPDRLVSVAGGRTHIGTDRPGIPGDGEGPARAIRVKPYRIDPLAVTAAWFADFVADTGYRTDAEHYGWSLVFHGFLTAPDALPAPVQTPWWRKVDGADWAHPLGPGSTLDGLSDHPVTHVSWNDATAFARWAGGRLPTEAEWEHAARGGDPSARFPWGDGDPTDDAPLCNIWQGRFPDLNTGADGYLGTAPTESFTSNGYGLFNMVGNTWEWCADPFRIRSQKRAARAANAAALRAGSRVLKGGSYLCHRSYCYRYRIAARTGVQADSSTGHCGFRIVAD